MTEPLDPTETKQYVGRYRILTPIGVGSSATVYRGLDEDTETEVAVKVLADNYSLVPDFRQRFLDETTLLMSIRSPAVAQVYGNGETDGGQPYIVLELADRGPLGQRVDELRRNESAPNRQDLIAIADHLSEALAAIHRAGIVHRDVSPGNILIRASSDNGIELRPLPSVQSGHVLMPDERYLLVDLGFAKDLQHASGLTAGGGTRGFAAPEQRDEVTVVDHRADIFGATAVVEWMAEGSHLVDELETFLELGLATDPEDRYQTIDDWRRGLLRALDRRPAAFQTAVVDKTATAASRVGGRKRLIGAAVVVGTVVAIGAGLTLTRTGSDDDAIGSESVETAIGELDQTAPDATGGTSASTSTPPVTEGSPTAQTVSDGTPAQTTTTIGSVTVASTTPSSNTTGSTTTSSSNTVTTVATTTTTVDPRFRFSPRAYVESPAAESSITGDLRIEGTAQYRDGVTGVALIVRRMSDDHVWTPASRSFEADWAQIPVTVNPVGENAVTWSYTVDDVYLEPGRYLIRVWARGTDANDPISDQREIVIPG